MQANKHTSGVNNMRNAMQVQYKFDNDGMLFFVKLGGNTVLLTCGDGYWSNVACDVRVTEMGMWVAANGDAHGDFYVRYDEDDWDNNVNGLIYTDSEFLEGVRELVKRMLEGLGEEYIDAERIERIASELNYSEQGMQEDGRVSFDAFALGDYMMEYADFVC
jgi:hypothetical protein